MTPDIALPATVILPVIGAGVSLISAPSRTLQRIATSVTLALLLANAIWLFSQVRSDGILVSNMGGWPAPVGITLVGDTLAAVMLVVSAAMLMIVALYTVGSDAGDDSSAAFHPVYLLLAAGISASFVTGDLFNLYVAFEVMLISSYVLLTINGSRSQVHAGMTYVVISLIASVLLVIGIGWVYAATGTVNMADISIAMPGIEPAVRTGLGVYFLLVFGIKAGLFPLFFWLPDAYPTAPAPVTAVFAGLLTKVGVYTIIRSQTLLFPHDGAWPLLLVLAGITMIVGALGAIAQDDMRRILSFQSVSHVGFMLMGLGLFTVFGLAATIFYVINHIVVNTALFLIAGRVEQLTGSANLRDTGGLLHRYPWLASGYGIAALSLAGIPPLAGFAAKLGLIQAAALEHSWLIMATALLASLLAIYVITKIWSGVFWGVNPEPEGDVSGRRWPLSAAATAAAVVGCLVITVAAGPIYRVAEEAAQELMDTGADSAYVQAVLR